MEITIWVERSMGLNITKEMARGSTIGMLKEALLTEDILGGMSAKDLLLAAPGGAVIGDDVELSEHLRELEFVQPGNEEPEVATRSDAEVDETKLLAVLPNAFGEELKWYMWNSCWHAANSHSAKTLQGQESIAKLQKANEDVARVSHHLGQLKAAGLLSDDALEDLRTEADAVGSSACTACSQQRQWNGQEVDSIAKPSELATELWRGLTEAIRLAGAAVYEIAANDHIKIEEAGMWARYHKSQGLEVQFHNAWNAHYAETPPLIPMPEPPQAVQQRKEPAAAPVSVIEESEPGDFRVMQGPLMKKPGKDPAGNKVIKLTRKVSSVVKTTGRTWQGPSGGSWVELDPLAEKPGWLLIEGPGFGLRGPFLERVDPNEDEAPIVLSVFSAIKKAVLMEVCVKPSNKVKKVQQWIVWRLEGSMPTRRIWCVNREPREVTEDTHFLKALRPLSEDTLIKEAGFTDGSSVIFVEVGAHGEFVGLENEIDEDIDSR
mmetsp:Transcript_69548/g.153821  ORF Transcript_69548/g.153821 Transcript_69548/m.153821 type:complete len:491 (-) Transcript_69548:36-1508(-)